MKNLYVINSLYVNENWGEKNVEIYVYADNIDKMFDYFSENYKIIEDDLEKVKDNNWEIWFEYENFDWYYGETIYWYELIKEDISQEKAEEYVLNQFLIYK